MADFSLEKFRSEILDGSGLARTNRFEVYILPPRALRAGSYGAISNLASLYIEQASIPLLNLTVKPFKIFGPTYQRPVTSEYGGEGMSITFHADRDMNIRKFFEDWMHAVVRPDRFTVGYQEDYISTVQIKQHDDKNNETYEIELLEAFPRNINIMELNNSSTNQTHRITVLFAYRYWRRSGIAERKNPVDIPRVIRNPEVPSFDLRLPETRKQWNWSTGSLDDSPGSDLPPSP